MIDYFFINKILMIIINTIGIWLGFWVYLSNRKSKINQLFSVMILIALSWITLCYFGGILIDNLDLSLFLGRIAYGMAALFMIPFYLFFSFLSQEKPNKFLNVFIPSTSIIIFFFSVFTSLMAVEMIEASIMGIYIGVVPVVGYGKFLYFGFAFFVAIYVITKILKRYFKASQEEKIKLQYLLLGITIFVVINSIFNIILTFTIGDARYYQIGNYSVIFFLGLTAYAIVKRQLFNIKVAMTEFLVWTMGIILFILIFVAPTTWFKIILSLVFATFCFIGYSLIKYIKKEERYKKDFLSKKLEKALFSEQDQEN